jgi:hypothetical protein
MAVRRGGWLALAALGATLLGAPCGALADSKSADKCAADLPDKAKMVYNAVTPDLAPGIVLADEVRQQVITLISQGQMTRNDARPAAMAAVPCLQAFLH